MGPWTYTVDEAEFEIDYEIDWVDDRETTQAYILSIKHKGVEFLDLLRKDLVDFISEKLNGHVDYD
jgi:hypothetical protein